MHIGGSSYRPPPAPRLRVSRQEACAANWRLNGPGYKEVPAAERVALRAVVDARREIIACRGGRVLLALILLTVAVILTAASLSVGPDFRAAQAQGTRGLFIARHAACVRSSCRWDGSFESTAGKVLIRDVTYGDPDPGMRAGTAIPARYSGRHGYVSASKSSWAWIEDVLAMVVGAAVLMIFIWRGPVRYAQRRRRDRQAISEMMQA
jgi:hypothetical protein